MKTIERVLQQMWYQRERLIEEALYGVTKTYYHTEDLFWLTSTEMYMSVIDIRSMLSIRAFDGEEWKQINFPIPFKEETTTYRFLWMVSEYKNTVIDTKRLKKEFFYHLNKLLQVIWGVHYKPIMP